MQRNLLTADQVARRLGVKLETIYAYVSRGVLGRTLGSDGRTSRFDAREVDALARRGRPRKGSERTGTVEVSLATAITGILGDRLVYRGRDARALAERASFEAVAELLWTGKLCSGAQWQPSPERIRVGKEACAVLPADASPLERLATCTAALAAAHPLRMDLSPNAVTDHARVLLFAFVEVLPLRGAGKKRLSPAFAARLLPRLSPLSATEARVALLDAALVLLADHELATSTLAARVAASTRADPFSVVLAGLGAVSGPLHGKAAVGVHRMLEEAASSGAELAVARTLTTFGKLPGFGHPVYQGTDPRAAGLLQRLPSVCKPPDLELIETVGRVASRSSGAHPNADYGLGALAFSLQMPIGSTEAIFAIARTAGWIAHALEEYGEPPLRFRAKSIYVGER